MDKNYNTVFDIHFRTVLLRFTAYVGIAHNLILHTCGSIKSSKRGCMFKNKFPCGVKHNAWIPK